MKDEGCWMLDNGSRSLCAWRPHAHVRVRLSCAREENLKIQPPRGLGGYPKFFFTPNLILFVSINSVQNFKIVAQPLLGEKFVVGGGWVVCKPILVFSLGFGQAEQFFKFYNIFKLPLQIYSQKTRSWICFFLVKSPTH